MRRDPKVPRTPHAPSSTLTSLYVGAVRSFTGPDGTRRLPAPDQRADRVIIEQNDEWLVGHRYLSQHSLDAILTDINQDNSKQEARELTAA